MPELRPCCVCRCTCGCVHECLCMHIHGNHGTQWQSEQPEGVYSLFPTYRSWGLNSGCLTWQQLPLSRRAFSRAPLTEWLAFCGSAGNHISYWWVSWAPSNRQVNPSDISLSSAVRRKGFFSQEGMYPALVGYSVSGWWFNSVTFRYIQP